MKASDAQRLLFFADAQKKLPEVQNAMHDKVRKGYDRIVMRIGIASASHDGSETHADMEIDISTGCLLLPHVRRLIEAELEKLGYEAEKL